MNTRNVLAARGHHLVCTAWRTGATQRSMRSRSRHFRIAASASDDDYMKLTNDILNKYTNPPSNAVQKRAASQPAPARSSSTPLSKVAAPPGNGVFLLILANVIIFGLDKFLHLPWCQTLYLNHARPQWWQFITSAFCHAGWEHLSMNMFNLLIFGKLIEEIEGWFGVWLTYILSAVGGALALFLTTPAVRGHVVTISMGASGAVFGMFAVAVLLRLRPNLRSLLEAGILGQFVVKQVVGEVRAQTVGGLTLAGHNVAHVAHLGGALVGVLLVLLLTKLPDPEAA